MSKKISMTLFTCDTVTPPLWLVFQLLTIWSFMHMLNMLNIHEYLADHHLSLPYRNCIECSRRSQHVCTTCSYCYSCHYKIERKEKENKMKRRPITLNRANPKKLPRTVRKQPKYHVDFVTYKIVP